MEAGPLGTVEKPLLDRKKLTRLKKECGYHGRYALHYLPRERTVGIVQKNSPGAMPGLFLVYFDAVFRISANASGCLSAS